MELLAAPTESYRRGRGRCERGRWGRGLHTWWTYLRLPAQAHGVIIGSWSPLSSGAGVSQWQMRHWSPPSDDCREARETCEQARGNASTAEISICECRGVKRCVCVGVEVCVCRGVEVCVCVGVERCVCRG